MPTQAAKPSLDGAAPAEHVSHFLGAEVVRILAACGVIWIHSTTPDLATLGTFANLSFACLGAALTTRSAFKAKPQSIPRYAWQRVLRIYVPFAIWSLLYAALHTALDDRSALKHLLRPGALIRGGDYHLWFLPFLFVATLIAFIIGRRIAGVQRRWQAVIVLLLGLLGVGIGVSPHPADTLGTGGMGRWIACAPSVLWGIGFGWCLQQRLIRAHGTVALIALLIAIAGECLVIHWPNLMWLVAGALMVFAFCYPYRAGGRLIAHLGRLTYGVYLMHMLFLIAIDRVAPGLAHTSDPLKSSETAVIVIACSFLLSDLIMRFRITRFLVA